MRPVPFSPLAQDPETDDVFDWKATGARRIQSHAETPKSLR